LSRWCSSRSATSSWWWARATSIAWFSASIWWLSRSMLAAGRVSPTSSRAAANAYRYLVSRAGGAANVAAFCQGVVRSAGP
jgi:hypothetical protein